MKVEERREHEWSTIFMAWFYDRDSFSSERLRVVERRSRTIEHIPIEKHAILNGIVRLVTLASVLETMLDYRIDVDSSSAYYLKHLEV
uniref:Uncharacterized protein n=1 Tax=Vespula pensylvanica TaxID=30213 RepID=A0A834K1J6_VESPE|nr:hypothetical protein H0235_016436 [Vespula pensylvanica]